MPRFWRRCTIRGWWPVLISGLRYPGTDQQFTEPRGSGWLNAWSPMVPFGMLYQTGWFYQNNKLVLGGYSAGTFSLDALYQEHLWYRNRWSNSNCGFDLASYRGTTIYFKPHLYFDYIVFIDPEYGDFREWMKQCMHPAVLLTHPQAFIVKSIRSGGPRRKLKKRHIPPPSTWSSGWRWMKDVCKDGLFSWYVCWIDLEEPWAPRTQDPQDYKWWQTGGVDTPPEWVGKWMDLQQLDPADALGKVVDGGGTAGIRLTDGTGTIGPTNMYNKLRYTPFVLKHPGMAGTDPKMPPVDSYPQILWFYKSFWQWGGSTVTIKKVCDPCFRTPSTFDRLKPQVWPTSKPTNISALWPGGAHEKEWSKSDWITILKQGMKHKLWPQGNGWDNVKPAFDPSTQSDTERRKPEQQDKVLKQLWDIVNKHYNEDPMQWDQRHWRCPHLGHR